MYKAVKACGSIGEFKQQDENDSYAVGSRDPWKKVAAGSPREMWSFC